MTGTWSSFAIIIIGMTAIILLEATEVSLSIPQFLPSCVIWDKLPYPSGPQLLLICSRRALIKSPSPELQWLKWGHAVKLIVSIKCSLHGKDMNIPREYEEGKKVRASQHLPNVTSSHLHPWLQPEKSLLSRKHSDRIHTKTISCCLWKGEEGTALEFSQAVSAMR